MIENPVHRWGLIVLVTACIVSAGFGDGVWRWGALFAGVPVIIAFHGVMTLLEKRRPGRGSAGLDDRPGAGEEPGA